MMNNGPTVEPETDAGVSSNAVSLYGQGDAMDDFPVLKAFQQYVDAEQAKAQKRTLTLCIFFSIIMAVVVGVFVMLLMNISQRNDQLVQMMIKDRDRQPMVIQPAPAPVVAPSNDAALKVLTDSVSALQRQLAEQQAKTAAAVSRATVAEEKASLPQPPSADQLAAQRKNQEDTAKLKKAKALLDAEREKLAKEKEALRQKQIELQRRKLYPDLYDEDGNLKPAPSPKRAAAPSARKTKSIRYFDVVDDEDDDDDEVVEVRRPASVRRVTKDGSYRYFDTEDDEDEVTDKVTPVRPVRKAVKKPTTSDKDLQLEGSGWDIPLE